MYLLCNKQANCNQIKTIYNSTTFPGPDLWLVGLSWDCKIHTIHNRFKTQYSNGLKTYLSPCGWVRLEGWLIGGASHRMSRYRMILWSTNSGCLIVLESFWNMFCCRERIVEYIVSLSREGFNIPSATGTTPQLTHPISTTPTTRSMARWSNNNTRHLDYRNAAREVYMILSDHILSSIYRNVRLFKRHTFNPPHIQPDYTYTDTRMDLPTSTVDDLLLGNVISMCGS